MAKKKILESVKDHILVPKHTKLSEKDKKDVLKKYNIDVKGSYVVGDHISDVLFAKNSGATGVYVLTGHGQEHLNELSKDTIVCKNLFHASKKILNLSSGKI